MAAGDSDPKTRAERSILGFLQSSEVIDDSHQFAASIGIAHGELESVIKSLSGFQFVDSQDIKKERWLLTDEGKAYALNGSPEAQVFAAVPPEGVPRADLEKKVGSQIFKIGSSQAVKNRWVEIGKQVVTRKVEHVEDSIKDVLRKIEDGKVIDEKDIAALRKRKLITLQTWKGYSLRKGPKYSPERKKVATDLTREHLLRCEKKSRISFFRWVSRRCQQTILLRAGSGILMHYSNRSNTLLVIHTIHSFLKFLPLQGNYLKIIWRK